MNNRKIRIFQFYFLLAVVSLWLYSCAQIVAPTGGEKDTDAPIIDTLGSTTNFQKNFKKQDIVFEFDEWIELRNVREQVLISPLMEAKEYKISIKKKSVVFSFEDETELKEDLTYIINFGEAVVDYTAGNAVPNMRFVFSTGDEIDSMSVSGSVIDAISGNPVPKAVVMLHDNLADTAITSVKPLYVIRTDKDGKFKLENVKSDTFQVFVLQETLADYKFDPLRESIGFIDSMIILDTNQLAPLQLVLSKPIAPLQKKSSVLDEFGIIKMGFNQPPKTIKLRADPPRDKLYSKVEGDTVFVWYNSADTSTWKLYLEKDTVFYDSLIVGSSRLDMEVDLDLQPMEKDPDEVLKVNPFDSLFLKFNFPIDLIDNGKIVLSQDSIDTPISLSATKDPNDHRRIVISKAFKAGKKYKLTIFPDALISIHGSPNDTVIYQLEAKTLEDLTNFDLNITGLDSAAQYRYELVTKKDGRILDRQTVNGVSSLELNYPKLDPLDLEATMILDRNKNNKWDSGNYRTKSQPEKIITKKFDKFLPNFDRSEDWNLSTLKELESDNQNNQ